METEYDVFEILPTRSVKWHRVAREKQRALDMLKAIGSRTFNECFATNLESREVIGRVNCGSPVAESVVEDYKAVAR